MARLVHAYTVGANLFLVGFCFATLAAGTCQRKTPTSDQTDPSGSCASVGYSSKCCPYGFSDECKAKDGDCYCHAGCFDDKNCCSDVHCCEDARTCAEADITSCCVPNERGVGCTVYDYVRKGSCSCAVSCGDTLNCCSDALSLINSTCKPCSNASLEPGYCLWDSNFSCMVKGIRKDYGKNRSNLYCYCDPYCMYRSLNDCCLDVPDNIDGKALRNITKKVYAPRENSRHSMPGESHFEEDYPETQVENDYGHYLAQFSAAKAVRMQMARSKWSTVSHKYEDRLQVSAKEQNDHSSDKSARPLSRNYPYKPRQHTTYSYRARPLPRAYAEEARPLPRAYTEEARPLPRAYTEEARPLPRAYAEEARPLPRAYTEEARPLPRAYTEEARPLPRAYAEEARPLPHAYIDEARPLPFDYPAHLHRHQNRPMQH